MPHGSDKAVPPDPLTLWHLFAEAARRTPDHAAIISPDSDDFHVTYSSLLERAEAAAAALRRLGVAPGEPIAIWAANLLNWPIYFLAAVRLGAVVVPILPAAPLDQVTHVLRSSEATTLVMGPGKRGERIKLALEMMPALRTADRTALWDPAFPKLARVIMHTDETPAGAYPGSVLAERASDEEEETSGGVLGRALERLSQGVSAVQAEADETPPPEDAHTTAALLYTSGTTGRRAVRALVTHHALLSSGREAAERLDLQPSDQMLLPVPFAHYSGLSLGLVATAAAGAAVLPVFDPDPKRVLLDIADAAPTVLVVTPRLLRSVIDLPELAGTKRDSVRTVVIVANPAQARLLEAAGAAFPGAEVVQAYGLAEAGGIIAMGRRGDRAEDRIGRIGRIFRGVEYRVTDPETGALVGPGEVGELRLRGPRIAREYWRDRATTAAAIDGDGFLRTGDLVGLDPDDALGFVGRLSDRIRTPHGPVDPREVEAFLGSFDASKVREAWVVGVPLPGTTVADGPAGGGSASAAGEGHHAGRSAAPPAELLVAAVKLAAGATITEAELLARAAEWLPEHKRPSRVVFVDEVPTGPAGAVLRHRLREQLAAQLAPPPPAARPGESGAHPSAKEPEVKS